MKHFYTAVFSRDYAYKGLILYNSLLQWDNDFVFFMVCLHDEVKALLEKMKLKKAAILSIKDIEEADLDLKKVKAQRSEKEYAWTVKASIMLYILNTFKEPEHIVWLDGDGQFLSSPEPIFAEWGSNSIMLTEERWSDYDQYLTNVFGRYNLGFIGFKKDFNGLDCLRWYRKRIIQWCFDRHEKGLWADQLYANDWLDRFKGVKVLKNIGVNLNPYICRSRVLTDREDGLYIQGQRIISFHLYGFKYFDGNEFDLCAHINPLYDDSLKLIYMPYIAACIEAVREIRKWDSSFYPIQRPKHRFIRNYFNLHYNSVVPKTRNQFCTLFSRDYIPQGLALYNSLKRYTPEFHLWILCVDDFTYSVLGQMELDNVTLLSLDNIMDEKLKGVNKKRKLNEFCWTLKPFLLTYIMNNHWNLESLIYLDSDLYFFQDASVILQDWGEGSVYVTKLGLSSKWANKVGKYSSGLVGLKRDSIGRECLAFWQQKCLDWCYGEFNNQRWREQKYIEEWERMAGPALVVSENIGINVGPWNIKKGTVSSRDSIYFFNDRELVSYHFSGFEVLDEESFIMCNRKTLPDNSHAIYSMYTRDVSNILKALKVRFGAPKAVR